MTRVNNGAISAYIINNMISALNVSASCAPYEDAGMENVQGSYRYLSYSSYPMFNGVISDKSIEKNPHQHFVDTTEFFSSKNVPFIWWWVQANPIPENVKTELERFNLQSLGTFLGVALKLDNLKSVENTTVIKEVTTEAEYQIFIDIVSQIFELNEAAKNDFTVLFGAYGHNGVFKHYLAYQEGQSASAVTAYVEDNVVGIYNCATLPQFQKHGLCTALIYNAVQEAKLKNCKYAIAQLMTTAMAKGLMEKMGFNVYCEIFPYSGG